MKKLTIGIIGSEGNMGKWFCRFFNEINEKKTEKYYYEILKSDIRLSDNENIQKDKLVSKSDVVIFSLPICETPKVINECCPYSREDQLWIEITSVKKDVWEVIEKIDVNVISLHPMFNQSVSRMKNQVILWLDGKKANKHWERWKEWLRELLEQNQAKIIPLNSPEEHDRLMAYVQVLVHFILICFAKTLQTDNGHFKDVQKVQSNNFRLLFNLYSRIVQQPNKEELYSGIHLCNDYSLAVIDNFLQAAKTLREYIADANRGKFISFLNEPIDHFDRDIVKKSHEESKVLFRLLADLDKESSCKVGIKQSRPGALQEILSVFSEMGVNLTSIHGYEEYKEDKKFAEFLIGYENVPDEAIKRFCKALEKFENVEYVEKASRKSMNKPFSEATKEESL